MKHSASLLAILVIVGFVAYPAFADLDNLDIGGKIKAMGVYTTNTLDFNNDGPESWYDERPSKEQYYIDDDQDAFARTEFHLWFQAELAENVTGRISLEADYAWNNHSAELPYYPGGYYGKMDDGYAWASYGHPYEDDLDVFVEEAYIKVADLYGMPATWTIGRQFIEIGDGFVLGDSLVYSPNTLAALGEWEQDPFDAIKSEIELSEDFLLTLLWSKAVETRWDAEDTDFHMINLGFYGMEKHVFEVYLFSAILDDEPRVDVYQGGLRGEGEILDGLSYHAEATMQFADEIEWEDYNGADNEDLKGWAAELGLKFAPPAMEANEVAFGFTFAYLSGDDDEDDGDYEAYIQFADNRVYGEIADGLNGLVSNWWGEEYAGVMVFNVDAAAALTDRLKAALEAYYFLASEDVEYLGESDDSIGWEIDGYLNYELTEDLSAMLAAGYFDPDDATEIWNAREHGLAGDDGAWFVRGGVSLTF